MLFRSAPTFQLAFAIVIIFAAFVLQVYCQPYMDVKEAGALVQTQTRGEILKLSRMLFMIRRLTKGTSKKLVDLEDKIEAETRAMDAEVKETQRHHHALFNLNTLETTLLCSAVIILTAGIIFDSDYIWLPEFRVSRSIITYFIMALIISSLVYYFMLTIREIRYATEKRKLRRKVAWQKLRNYYKIVAHKMKEDSQEQSEQIDRAVDRANFVKLVTKEGGPVELKLTSKQEKTVKGRRSVPTPSNGSADAAAPPIPRKKLSLRAAGAVTLMALKPPPVPSRGGGGRGGGRIRPCLP